MYNSLLSAPVLLLQQQVPSCRGNQPNHYNCSIQTQSQKSIHNVRYDSQFSPVSPQPTADQGLLWRPLKKTGHHRGCGILISGGILLRLVGMQVYSYIYLMDALSCLFVANCSFWIRMLKERKSIERVLSGNSCL